MAIVYPELLRRAKERTLSKAELQNLPDDPTVPRRALFSLLFATGNLHLLPQHWVSDPSISNNGELLQALGRNPPQNLALVDTWLDRNLVSTAEVYAALGCLPPTRLNLEPRQEARVATKLLRAAFAHHKEESLPDWVLNALKPALASEPWLMYKANRPELHTGVRPRTVDDWVTMAKTPCVGLTPWAKLSPTARHKVLWVATNHQTLAFIDYPGFTEDIIYAEQHRPTKILERLLSNLDLHLLLPAAIFATNAEHYTKVKQAIEGRLQQQPSLEPTIGPWLIDLAQARLQYEANRHRTQKQLA